jgi:putative flippase GtrA
MRNEKSESLIQFIKFALVGASNTLVDWIIFYLLVSTILFDQHSTAKAISFVVAVLNSFLWNTVWTFRNEYKNIDAKSIVFIKFVVISLIGWGVNLYVFNLSSMMMTFQIFNRDLLPLVLASAAAIVVNFFGNKLWAYKK